MDKLEELKFYLKYFEELLNNEDKDVDYSTIEEYLKKAEHLNDLIDKELENDSNLIRDKDIFDLINQNHLEIIEESNNLVHLNELYLLKQDMISINKSNLMINDMIGFNELKCYLDSINFSDEKINKFSFMIYGLIGSGKTTFLILYLLKKKILSFSSNSNNQNNSQVYLIDLEAIKNDLNFDKIQESINNLLNRNQSQTCVILLKNCECLFDDEIALKTIGDLLYELNDVNERCLYILISNQPWRLHLSLVDCFNMKFCIQNSNINELNLLFLKTIEKKSSNFWILKEEFSNLLNKSNLLESIISKDSIITPKIVVKLADELFEIAKQFMMDILEVKLKDHNININDFHSFTSKTISNKNKWQFLNKKHSVVRAFNTTNNSSRRESKISTISRNSVSYSTSNNNGHLFVLIKSNMWQEFSNELIKKLQEKLSEIIEKISNMNEEFNRIDEFKKNLQ